VYVPSFSCTTTTEFEEHEYEMSRRGNSTLSRRECV
jgi:hypothetical protein